MFKWTIADRIRIALRGGRRLDLFYLLASAAKPLTPIERIEWLERLVFWVRGTSGDESSPETRIRFLLQRLNQQPEWKEAGAQQLRAILRDASALYLFTEIGVPNASVFLNEAIQRAMRAVLPPEENPKSLASALERVFWDRKDSHWLLSIPNELREELLEWVRYGMTTDEPLAGGIFDDAIGACVVLGVRLAEIAVREDVVLRAPEHLTLNNPFIRMRTALDTLLAVIRNPRTEEELTAADRFLRQELAECRRFLGSVQSHLERFGVSVDLVFQLERAKSYLDRLDELVYLLVGLKKLPFKASSERVNFEAQAWAFFGLLVHGSLEERRLWRLVRENLTLVARKTIERTGYVGEDYITRDSAEYRKMFYSAAGGGALTALTALVKYLQPHHMAPFFEATYLALDYSLSFLLMHFLHLKLATKQPAMTAAALASRLGNQGGQEGADAGFVEEVARISRSQFAAVAGNILAVIPAALAVDGLSLLMFNQHVLHDWKARAVLSSINPWTTMTIFYAALTGVLLWLSGFIAGWIENAYVYYRVPYSLRSHRFLRNLLGVRRLEVFVDWISHNIMGVQSAIALGVLLAFVPQIGTFFGLPLDVRHITLTTGAATFALATLPPWVLGWKFCLMIASGVFFIGLMNFFVSFALALSVALRARSIDAARLSRLLAKVLREVTRSPGKFLIPGPETKPQAVPFSEPVR